MNALLENPFMLFVLATLTAVLGSIGGKMLDRMFGRSEQDAMLAGRLAAIEVTLAHVTADQAAHAAQSADLTELKIGQARLETRFEVIERTISQQPRQVAEVVAYALKAALGELRAAT
jgi:hypothetical protein